MSESEVLANGGSGGGGGGGGGMTSEGGGGTAGVSFESVFQQVLVDRGCVFGCHDETASGNLELSPTELGEPDRDVAYAALVGPTSATTACGGQPLVTPGSPEESLLWRKLAAKVDPTVEVCGDPMPRNSNPFTQADVLAIEAWILDGANP